MVKPVVGDVVVLPFPQSDLQPGKRRPALVVASLTGDDVILCQITSQSRSDPYAVALALSDLQKGRLAVDSFIRPHRLFTVDSSIILYSAGQVTLEKVEEVLEKIRLLFT